MRQQARFASVVLVVAGTALAAAQQSSGPPVPSPDTPTFKVQVDYVEVDALVTNAQGTFVRNLKKEDFEIFEDGKPQTIAAFGLVDVPIERFERPLFAPQPVEPDVMTNERPFDGRVYVLVIDDLHTEPLRTQLVKNAARQFIQQRLGANDLAAVVHTFGPRDASQDFTNNKRLLLAAVDRTMGQKLPSGGGGGFGRGGPGRGLAGAQDAERGLNARRSLETLRDLADWFGGVRGRRKTILFFSEGIDYQIANMFRSGSAAADILESTRDAVTSANRSNVSIYGIDPRGLTQLADETIGRSNVGPGALMGLSNALQRSQDSLRELSDETGGFAVVNTNNFSTAFDRIVQDNSTYYVLAYYPPGDKRDGKFHETQVRVSQPGLTVHARKGYVSPKGKPSTAASPGPAGQASADIREALDSPLPVSGLTLHVFAAPFRGAAPNASVLLGAEILGRDLRLDAAGKESDFVEFSYVAIDAQGKIRGSNTARISLNLKPDTRSQVVETGLRVLNRIDLPPNRYQVRFAARDPSGGALGTVLYTLEVPDFNKGPLSMSGIVMTSLVGAMMPTARADELLNQALPAPPAALREFPQNDELALFAEVYDNEGSTPHRVVITATVTTDEGKVVFKNDQERLSSELQSKRGGYGYTARVPMKDLAPGLHVLRIAAQSTLGHDVAIAREVQFKVVSSR